MKPDIYKLKIYTLPLFILVSPVLLLFCLPTFIYIQRTVLHSVHGACEKYIA